MESYKKKKKRQIPISEKSNSDGTYNTHFYCSIYNSKVQDLMEALREKKTKKTNNNNKRTPCETHHVLIE